MASYFPLVVDSVAGTINELPSGDDLNLLGSNIANVVNITTSNIGNISTGNITGNGNITISGTANITGNANIGNIGTSGLIVATGNITGGNLIGTLARGNSNVNIPSANGNVNISAVGNANVVVITGTGANINGYARVTGNATFTGGNITFSNIANFHIPGGSTGQILSTDGTGNLYWGIGGGGGGGGSGSPSAIQEFSASAGQTTFTITGGYGIGTLLVFVNGIQRGNNDFTATDGTTVVLGTPSASGDVIKVVFTMPALIVNNFDSYALMMSIVMGS